jgi:rod shape-determining protein MreC
LLVLASITIITLDYRGDGKTAISHVKQWAHDAFAPVQGAVDDAARPIGSFLSGSVHGAALEQQNAKMRTEIGLLQRQALERQNEVNTLRTLEQLDKLPWAGAIAKVTAEVVALNPSNFAATVQLDVGTSSGVDVGMPVVGGAGLVGQVIESWSTGCTVRLITDTLSSVGVRYGNPGNYALVDGEGVSRALQVQYIAPGSVVRKGEVLTTSGLQDALFPPGLPVAVVTSFASSPSSVQQAVSAQPVANLTSLQYVDVLEWEPAS